MPPREKIGQAERSGSVPLPWGGNIHHPTDSTLLADGIRVITRWLIEGKRTYNTNTVISLQRSPAGCEEAGHDDPQYPQDTVRQGAYRDLLQYAGSWWAYREESQSPNLPL